MSSLKARALRHNSCGNPKPLKHSSAVHQEAQMKKSSMLIVAVIVLIAGALVYQFLLHPNPYTGESPAEEQGIVKQSP
ncbi:hypothetical protein ASG68_22740 [Rhizobium sp. Leaf453]|nr:hypothetical protein ASG42_24620 [Rhizobium sp. Leaf391]KQU08407.1 hypothetical protein ASG68_22740 [Rhizobium sp. Leaf453]